jgi:hypothetical protein
MRLQLGLCTLGLLALVAASTAVLLKTDLTGAQHAAASPAFAAMLASGHN